MNLRIFHTIKKQAGTPKMLLPSCFHGIASHPESLPALAECSELTWICQFNPQNAMEAAKMLETLSNLPTEKLPEFVVFDNHPSIHTSTDNTLSFLRDVLPLGAQFCEDHPTVGANYQRLNAHGKPLNDHVVGICHSFPHHSIAELAIVLDVLLPTRLVLSPQTMANTMKEKSANIDWDGTIDEDDWEAVVQNTDMLAFNGLDSSKDFDELAKHVWKAQEQDGAQNAHVICNTAQEANELERMFKQTCKD